MKAIRAKTYPWPISTLLWWRFNYRVWRGKPAHVVHKGRFWAMSKVYKNLYLVNSVDPIKRYDGRKK